MVCICGQSNAYYLKYGIKIMRLKKTVSTQFTLFTYIQSIDPDLVKNQIGCGIRQYN